MGIDELLTQGSAYEFTTDEIAMLSTLDKHSSIQIIETARKSISAYGMNQVALTFAAVFIVVGSTCLYVENVIANPVILSVVGIGLFGLLLGVMVPKISRLGDRSILLIRVVVQLSGPDALGQVLIWYRELMGSNQLVSPVELYQYALRSSIQNVCYLVDSSFRLSPKAHQSLFRLMMHASGNRIFYAPKQPASPDELALVEIARPIAKSLFSAAEISKLGWADS